MTQTCEATDVLTIDNATAGVGDAVVYSWMLTSANADGERLRIHPRGNREVFELLNCGQWCEPEEPTFEQVIGNHPPKGEPGGRGWLRLWLDEHGFEGVPFVNPTHNLTADELERAENVWASRKGTGPKVLICPDGPWPMRVWNEINYARVAVGLEEQGYRTIASLAAYRSHPFPWAMGRMKLREFAALVATADMVLGNESGPVHLAATLGIKAYCIYGPTTRELMHEQYGDAVVPITTTRDRIPCLGCNFEFDKGCRQWCGQSCAAMADVTAFQVVQTITGKPMSGRPAVMLPTVSGRPVRPKPRLQFYVQDECIIADVFDNDCYRLSELPGHPSRFIDVGACIGAFAAKVRSLYADASVVMVECEPSNAKACRENPSLAGFDLVEAAALYGRDSARLMTTVFAGSRNTGGSTIAESAEAKQYSEEYRDGGSVPTVTLEAIMDARGWDRVDVVKLDCEGSEMNIMEHCDKDRVGCFVGEWHDRERFMDLVQRRYSDWTLDILKDGPQLGLFRLTHP